jgi:hypothetical protein
VFTRDCIRNLKRARAISRGCAGTARAFLDAMARLAFAALLASILAYAAGCTTRSLNFVGDGGGTDGGPRDFAGLDFAGVSCGKLDEKSCLAAQPACAADYCLECACTPTFIGCRAANAKGLPCPPVGCAPPNCTCDGLDEKSCIASEATLGCTPNYCPDCKGGQYYTGCLAANAGAGVCPAVCPAGCHSQSDCGGGQECLAPGESAGCGICFVPDKTCNSDGDCTTGSICEVAPCTCNGARSCVPGCKTQSDCPEGTTCNSNFRCNATNCQTAAQCPTYFNCSLGSHCERKMCTTDSQCGGGFCVKGQCYGALGSCTFPPA